MMRIDESSSAVRRIRDAITASTSAPAHRPNHRSAPPGIVTIWGAGASISSGIPGGWYMLARMLEDLRAVRDTHEFCRRLGRDVERADAIFAEPERASLEEVLQLYARLYDVERLHGWLRQFIPIRPLANHPPFFPSIAHEFCAHLTNTRVLDCYISLNFDELLESAIREELPEGATHVIASLSEFERLRNRRTDEWREEFGTDAPHCFVLKPHGTISRRLSLRHLPDRVEAFEIQKRDVLREALRDRVVLFLGFGSYNEDFRLAFTEAFAEGITDDIVIVDLKPEEVANRLPSGRHTRQVFAYKGDIEGFFVELIDELYGPRATSAQPPGGTEAVERWRRRQKPTRHLVRSLVFRLFSRRLALPGDEDAYRLMHHELKTLSPAWFSTRLYELELLIYLLKSRGLFIDFYSGECPRIRRAYRTCRRALEEEEGRAPDLRPAKVLQDVLGEEMIETLPVRKRDGQRTLAMNWVILKHATEEGAEPDLDGVCAKLAKRYAQWLRKRVEGPERALLSAELVSKDPASRQTFEEELAARLDELWQDFDVDVRDRQLHGVLRFRSPRQLRGRRELEEATMTILKDGRWTELRVLTTSGEWLGRSLPLMDSWGDGKRRVVKVLSLLDGGLMDERYFHYVYVTRSLARFVTMLNGCTNLELDWRCMMSCEHHMMIASIPQPEGGVKMSGIYFWRPGKCPLITPVLLEDPEDVGTLAKYFDDRYDSRDSFLGRPIGDGGTLLQLRVGESSVNGLIASCDMGKRIQAILDIPSAAKPVFLLSK